MTLSEMQAVIQTTGAGFVDLANTVQTDETITTDVYHVPVCNVPKTIFFIQVLDHAKEHREQIKAILTHLGLEPPKLDAFWYFLAQEKEDKVMSP